MSPRVASLLPSATEIACAIGAGADLVGISHECDFPPEVRGLPVLTRSRLAAAESDREIDVRVRELTQAGEDLYEVDARGLRGAAPDVVLTQDLCDVCAVSPDGVRAALAASGLEARLVTLRADSLDGVAWDAIEVGEAVGREEAARGLAARFQERLAAVRGRTAALEPLRVAALEWLDPPFAAGHWVPQMIGLAGGVEVLGAGGEPSRRVSWREVEEAAPEALCVVPCGFDVARARRAWLAARRGLAAQGSPLAGLPAFVLDASALVSRPGPRLARGVEVLAALLHPDAGLPAADPREGSAA
ncbi:MAG TPA: ABC transporter substrate-binding protein [Gemmatimonadota bacterium]|jgi:iron complex transport system substrate-binding protein